MTKDQRMARNLRYIFIALAAVAAANAMKHLLRHGDYPAIGLVVIKDLVMGIVGWYLFLKCRPTQEARFQNLASMSLHTLLLISFASDYAIVLLKS